MRDVLHNRLGYTVNSDKRLTKQDVLDALPKYSVWYSLTHGLVDDADVFKTIRVCQSEKWNWKAEEIGPDFISNNINGNEYKLVFLNGCLTADEKAGSSADQFKAAFNAKAYVGWTVSVGGNAASGAEKFFINLDDGQTIEQAYIAVKDTHVCKYLKWLGIADKSNIIDLKAQ